MTLIPTHIHPPTVLAFGTAILDGPNDRIGGMFIAPKDGTIDRIAVYCTAVTSPPSYLAELVTVTAGLPNFGTLIAANTSGNVTPAAATHHLISLTASHAIQAGDLVGTTLSAAGAGAGANATFNARQTSTAPFTPTTPRAVADLSAGTWSAQSVVPTVVPVYSDGSYFPLCIANAVSTNRDYQSTSTPDERGNRFTQLGAQRCNGAAFTLRNLNASSNYIVKLYPSSPDNAAPLASWTGTYANVVRNTSESGVLIAYWDGVDLTDGSDYRIALVPTTANQLRFAAEQSCPSEDARKAVSNLWATSRTRTADGDDGAWTDAVENYYPAWPIYDQTTAAAGGLRRHSGMQGGCRG